jgi:tetratricopeptide (TPR) repeat protein
MRNSRERSDMVSDTGKTIKIFSSAIILYLFLASCGCISPSPPLFEKNLSQFADEINASHSYYDALVREDPSNATAWCIRGNYYNDAFSQYDAALQSYNRSLELDPEYGYAWFSKGVTLQNMKHYNESKQCFEKALLYDPTLGSVIARAEQ